MILVLFGQPNSGKTTLAKQFPSFKNIDGDELRLLRKWKRIQKGNQVYVFTTTKGIPISRKTAHNMLRELGVRAGFTFQVHPHMLRHAYGYHMVNQGNSLRIIQAWLGHRDVNHTVRYTALSANAFDGVKW